MRGLLAAGFLVACQYTAPQVPNDGDPPPDSPAPIVCGDLTCDPNATCGAGPSCACNGGFTGDGFTCVDFDECGIANGGCPSLCLNTPGAFTCASPATCAEVKALVPSAADGDHTLFIDGNPNEPWLAHCAGMSAAPLEYLTLGATSRYTAGGSSPGTSVTTVYSKVRILLDPPRILISDRTFALSTGMLNHDGSGTMVTSMPVGVAMDCVGNNSNIGTSTIDLTSTNFALSAASFAEGGFQPDHTLFLTNNNQEFSSTGGGRCGWFGPIAATQDPFDNNVPNATLPLVYVE